MHAHYLDRIRSFEGFTTEAKWDYAQHSNGFGTKALFPGERIGLDEARRRFAAEIAEARQFVDRHAAGWDEGTKAALTSLTFNAGTRWATSGLGEAVRNADIDAVRSRFLEYTKAGGQDLPGLARRRLAEVLWIGEAHPGEAAPAPAAPAIVADRPAAPLPATETEVVVNRAPSPAADPRPIAPGMTHPPFQAPHTFADDVAAAQHAARIYTTALLLLALDLRPTAQEPTRVERA
jgi:lysozyme